MTACKNASLSTENVSVKLYFCFKKRFAFNSLLLWPKICFVKKGKFKYILPS